MGVTRRHVTFAGLTGGVGIVLALLQQVAATRESFVKAQAYGDAKADSLKVCRILLREKTRELKLCYKSHGRKVSRAPEPEKGTLLASMGKAAHWVTGPVRWLFGG